MLQYCHFLNYSTDEDKPFISKLSLLFLMLSVWTSVLIMVPVIWFTIMYNFSTIKISCKICKNRWGSSVPRVSVPVSCLCLYLWVSPNPIKIYFDAELARQTNCSECDLFTLLYFVSKPLNPPNDLQQIFSFAPMFRVDTLLSLGVSCICVYVYIYTCNDLCQHATSVVSVGPVPKGVDSDLSSWIM